jgi:hypothetical protein
LGYIVDFTSVGVPGDELALLVFEEGERHPFAGEEEIELLVVVKVGP